MIISRRALTHAAHIIVCILTREGTTGIGEYSPYLSNPGKSMESAMVVIQYLTAALKGLDAPGLASYHHAMINTIYANNRIKGGFDMVL